MNRQLQKEIRTYREFYREYELFCAYVTLRMMYDCTPDDTDLWNAIEQLKQRIDNIPTEDEEEI